MWNLNKISFLYIFQIIENFGIEMSLDATLPNIQVKLKIKAKNLDKKDFLGLGHSDPFVVLKNSKTDETIYQTEYIKNNSKPEFDAFSLKLDQNTFEEPIHLKVYDWDKNGDHSFIGEFHANLAEIHQKDNKERTYVCNNDQKKKPYSGEVTLSILSLVEDKPKAMENIKEIKFKLSHKREFCFILSPLYHSVYF